MLTLALAPLPETLRFTCLSPGVYDSNDGRATLYRIEGCYPPAWNVEWTIGYQNWLADNGGADRGPGSLALTLIVDGARTYRDALALAAEAWPALRALLADIEGGAA